MNFLGVLGTVIFVLISLHILFINWPIWIIAKIKYSYKLKKTVYYVSGVLTTIYAFLVYNYLCTGKEMIQAIAHFVICFMLGLLAYLPVLFLLLTIIIFIRRKQS